jgi:hypothetical protein
MSIPDGKGTLNNMAGYSRTLSEMTGRARQQQVESAQGAGTARGPRLSSARAAENRILHCGHIPCKVSTTALQDADGNFLAYAGYSQAGGPDIGA